MAVSTSKAEWPGYASWIGELALRRSWCIQTQTLRLFVSSSSTGRNATHLLLNVVDAAMRQWAGRAGRTPWMRGTVATALLLLTIAVATLLSHLLPPPIIVVRRAPGAMHMSGWKAAAARKRALSKATFTTPLSALPAWVISLPRSSDRREAFEKTARNRNLTFEYFTAVDGKAKDPAHGAPFPEEGLLWESQRRLFWEDCQQVWGRPRKALVEKRDRAVHASKEACDVSHFRLMHRLLASSQEATLVMEDDAIPVKHFASRLDMVMRGLPEDWDVVQLRSCYPKPLPSWAVIQQGLRIHRKGGCTTCYLMRRAGAAAVLAAVAGGRACRGNVDELMFVDMARRGELQIYDADPPLCDLTFAPTTIKV